MRVSGASELPAAQFPWAKLRGNGFRLCSYVYARLWTLVGISLVFGWFGNCVRQFLRLQLVPFIHFFSCVRCGDFHGIAPDNFVKNLMENNVPHAFLDLHLSHIGTRFYQPKKIQSPKLDTKDSFLYCYCPQGLNCSTHDWQAVDNCLQTTYMCICVCVCVCVCGAK